MIETSLKGKVALVTGAASGIGQATAIALARADAGVALVDRNEEGLRETEQRIVDLGGQAWSFVFDLRNFASVRDLIADVLVETHHIHILAQCAGIADGNSLLDVTPEVWDEIYTINAKAPFFLMQGVAHHMAGCGEGGKIVNVSSSSAFRALHTPSVYGSSKAALNHYSRIAAAELGKHNINVNVVAPGLTRTAMTKNYDHQAMVSNGPIANFLARPFEPEDVANIILFLCLPESRQMTGQVVHTSAGLVL